MIEALSYSFVQNALLAGLLVSISCGIVGALVVVNRMTFIAGGIAHGVYGGLGLAIFLGVSPLFGALAFALALSLVLAYLTYQNRRRTDAMIGAIWAFGMAFGVIMIDLKGGVNTDIMGFLFGSILSVSGGDLWMMAVVCALIIALALVFYKELLAVSFDAEFAALQGLNTKLFYTLLIILASLCIVASIRAVGLILVIALISIPPFIAERFCSHLGTLMAASSALSVLFTLIGLAISYQFDLTSGAAIIMVACGAFAVSCAVKNRKG
jgi:zinc transport system permease protein